MTHKNFSFWLCTLLSGFVIGIASQRIPAAEISDNSKAYSFGCHHTIQPQLKANTAWKYHHVTNDCSKGKYRF